MRIKKLKNIGNETNGIILQAINIQKASKIAAKAPIERFINLSPYPQPNNKMCFI